MDNYDVLFEAWKIIQNIFFLPQKKHSRTWMNDAFIYIYILLYTQSALQ